MAARDKNKAERAAQAKAKDKAAKAKEKERAAKQKEKERAAKQKEKERAAKQKEKERAAKQKEKERAAKQKEKDRAAKAKEKAAKDRAKEKAAKDKAKQKAAKERDRARRAEREEPTVQEPGAEEQAVDESSLDAAEEPAVDEQAVEEQPEDEPARPARRRRTARTAGPSLEPVPANDRTIRPKGYIAEALGKEDAVERATQRATLAASYTTRDHDVIRAWAETRGGRPADVAGTGRRGRGGAGVLRIEFPDGPGDDSRLADVDWSTFFSTFDSSDVDFLYQERVRTGDVSRFHKLVRASA